MPLSHYALDAFVSQELSKLTACVPQSLAAEFPNRSNWLDQFVLRRIFHNHVADDRAALAFLLVRRAEAALDEWELAREAATRQDVRRPSVYFKALRHFENCIASLWQGLKVGSRSLDTRPFVKGDGSVFDRLNWLYNEARHFDPKDLQAGDLHRLWIANDGLRTREQSVSFEEISEELRRLGRIAQDIVGGGAQRAG
jgi:hypothetical protein